MPRPPELLADVMVEVVRHNRERDAARLLDRAAGQYRIQSERRVVAETNLASGKRLREVGGQGTPDDIRAVEGQATGIDEHAAQS